MTPTVLSTVDQGTPPTITYTPVGETIEISVAGAAFTGANSLMRAGVQPWADVPGGLAHR